MRDRYKNRYIVEYYLSDPDETSDNKSNRVNLGLNEKQDHSVQVKKGKERKGHKRKIWKSDRLFKGRGEGERRKGNELRKERRK